MGLYKGRITDNDVTLFKRNGSLAVAFGSGMTQHTAPAIQLGASETGRIFAGNNQMNPLGGAVASTVVSPQPTWLPVVPEMNIALGMIMAIVSFVTAIEDSFEYDGEGRVLGRPIRRENYQIVDFESFLPEDMTA